MSGFFALGAVIATLTAIALFFPASPLEPMWRLNPKAHVAFLGMGRWAIALMLVVATSCALSAAGLWMGGLWGHRLALVLLAVNLAGDVANALLRGDLRTLVGIPIAAALIAYLLSAGVRRHFVGTNAAV